MCKCLSIVWVVNQVCFDSYFICYICHNNYFRHLISVVDFGMVWLGDACPQVADGGMDSIWRVAVNVSNKHSWTDYKGGRGANNSLP